MCAVYPEVVVVAGGCYLWRLVAVGFVDYSGMSRIPTIGTMICTSVPISSAAAAAFFGI